MTQSEVKFRFLRAYRQWRMRNRGMSVLKDGPELDAIRGLGKSVTPLILNYMRADPDWFFFTAIRAAEQADVVEIPEEARGRLSEITRLYLTWGEKAYPPTAEELFEASKLATQAGDRFTECVVRFDPRCNYASSYFKGCLDSANRCYEKSAYLRARAVLMCSKHVENGHESAKSGS